jgi:hypothetical protein
MRESLGQTRAQLGSACDGHGLCRIAQGTKRCVPLHAQRNEAAMHRSHVLGLVCALVFVAPVVLWICGIVLRLSVMLANMVFEGSAAPDSRHSDPSNLACYPQAGVRIGHPIPVPDVGRAMVIMFAIFMAFALIRAFVLLLVALVLHPEMIRQAPWSRLLSSDAQTLCTLAIGSVVDVAMLAILLPTSAGRACLVTILKVGLSIVAYVVVSLAIGTVIQMTGMAPQLLDQFRH